jgi:hypothetical protein
MYKVLAGEEERREGEEEWERKNWGRKFSYNIFALRVDGRISGPVSKRRDAGGCIGREVVVVEWVGVIQNIYIIKKNGGEEEGGEVGRVEGWRKVREGEEKAKGKGIERWRER